MIFLFGLIISEARTGGPAEAEGMGGRGSQLLVEGSWGSHGRACDYYPLGFTSIFWPDKIQAVGKVN